MVAKVAGGIIGLGLIGTGSVAMAKPEWFGINKEVPWTPLSKDSDFTSSNSRYSGKFGDTYKNYLVGATENKDWWEWSFERLKEDSRKQEADQQPSEQFKFVESGDNKKITKAFDNSTTPDATALNQICKAVYKAETGNVKSNPTTSGTNAEYKDIDVWKYCSPVGAVPKKVSEQTEESSSYNNNNWIGKTKEGELLSIKHPNNQELWKLKNDEFFGKGIFTSTTPRTFDGNDKFFKALFEEGSKGKNSLRDKCEEAYKYQSTENPDAANKTKDDHVVKYCSLKSIQ